MRSCGSEVGDGRSGRGGGGGNEGRTEGGKGEKVERGRGDGTTSLLESDDTNSITSSMLQLALIQRRALSFGDSSLQKGEMRRGG
eukprot:766005-Hanusia_phi.AAC.1